MDPRGWRTTRIIPAVTLGGRSSQVVVGIVGTQGDPQIAMRIGERGETVVLPGLTVAREFVDAFTEIVGEKYQLDQGENQ